MNPRILFVGEAGVGQTSQDRADALQRLGASVTIVSPRFRRSFLGKVDRKIARYTQFGVCISDFNRAILAELQNARYDLLWLDKGWMVHPSTLKFAKARVGNIVLFNNDNPWADIERGQWRLLIKGLPLVDLVLAPRYGVHRLYEQHGARETAFIEFAFEKSRQYPDEGQTRKIHDICFVGTASKDSDGVREHRTQFIRRLVGVFPGQVSVFGHGWDKALKGRAGKARMVGGVQNGAEYRQRILESKLNLGFITRNNWDESSHRAFEIAACGGCLVAERSFRLEQSFEPDREAVFFTGFEECVAKIRQVLANEDRREAIASAGKARAWSSGYDNDSRLRNITQQSRILRAYF